VLDGRVYVIAGFNAQGQSSTTVEVYDPAADRWERRASLPQGRDHAMAAAFGGKVYVFGGNSGGALRTVMAYDPARDTWTRVADMPFRRVAGGAAVLADRIVVAGGTGDSPETSMFYDPARDTWSTGPRLAEPREHLGMTAAGGKVYVLGGRWDDVLKARTEVLDSPGGSFRTLAPMPTARGGTAAGSVDGLVVVAGGEAFNPTRTFKEVEVYDPATDAWTKAPGMPTPRHGLAVQGVGGILYVIGGGPTAGLSVAPQNEALDLR
jgi:N-acetylneuraminic acid mutarotase